MDKITCMKVFCSVVKEGGFSASARRLGKSKVMISRCVAHLESELGLRLLQRTTRKMSPTEDGLAYYERAQSLLEELDDLDSSVKDRAQVASGRLRLAVPSEAFTSRHLVPFLLEFAREQSQLEFDIVLADRYVDIVDEGFDAAIRIGKFEDSSLIARKLKDMELILCASARYLESHPIIETPHDITKHNYICDSNYRGAQNISFYRSGEHVSVRMNSALRFNSSVITTRFIQHDFGIALCPTFMITEELAKKEFLRILPDWEIQRGGIYLMYSHRKHLSAKVQLFADSLSNYFAARDM
ncbi:MAG: DNA-binding transcriptional LysR family regulator [Flavobacteriales bacterium]|jgi:DNA-binding transcriptional LysR family regulator